MPDRQNIAATSAEMIIEGAQSIIEALGPCDHDAPRLAKSGRIPIFPEISSQAMLPRSAYDHLGGAHKQQITAMLQERLAALRHRLARRYAQLAEQLYSTDHIGLSDGDVESMLVLGFEARYHRYIDALRKTLADTMFRGTSSVDTRNTRGGFGDRTLRILETAFNYTKSPLSTEIDHLAKLTTLETHQVRTWFQNKRNRGNKPSANSKKQLRTASASHVQSSTQLPIVDGRRVASLPSRKYVPPTQNRATRPLPRRNVNPPTQIQDIPLERTLSQDSHESDGTNFSFSSIPSNGGFTGFQYPAVQSIPQQPIYNLDPLISATYAQPQYNQPILHPSVPLNPLPIDQYNYNSYGDINNSYPTYPQPTQNELDFESYLNLNIDNLAPPTEDFGYDLEAQITAALRPSTDPLSFNSTLAPSPSDGSQYSDFSAGWFNEFDFNVVEGEVEEGMELLKVVLDGMSRSNSVIESPIEKTMEMDGTSMGQRVKTDMGGRSESPETVASFALNSTSGSVKGESGSGRQSPIPGPSTLNSNSTSTSVVDDADLSFMFNFDLEPVSNGMNVEYGQGQNGLASGSGSGSGWIEGVLPFDMGDHVMGTA